MKSVMDAMVEKIWKPHGYDSNVSLLDIGYKSAGVDEGWEGSLL